MEIQYSENTIVETQYSENTIVETQYSENTIVATLVKIQLQKVICILHVIEFPATFQKCFFKRIS